MMTETFYLATPSLGGLLVSGEDAALFLQGQVTCDVNALDNKSGCGAFCNAKGRVICTFFSLKTENGFLLIMPTQRLEEIQARLNRYKLRAKVTITTQALTELPCELPANFPWLTPETSEEFLPQWLNLDQFGGISFSKGCYTGQEIVARTHYLGEVKRRLFLATYADKSAVIDGNSPIIDENNVVVGHVLMAHEGVLQCVLTVERQHEVLRLASSFQKIVVMKEIL